MLTENNIQDLHNLLQKASAVIMEVYNTDDFGVEIKGDNSPLTRADKASNDILVAGLQSLFPDIHVLSEDGKERPYQERKDRDLFWSVDPLDGTKEFINRNGEFAICVGLVKNKKPVFGMIAVPVQEMIYRGGVESGVWKKSYTGTKEKLTGALEKEFTNETALSLVGSRSHSGEKDQAFASSLEDQGHSIEFVAAGSALKFCKLAEGSTDIYARFKPTMERDTAAGHALVEAVGYTFISTNKVDSGTTSSFLYNKEELVNSGFVVYPTGLELPNFL